MVRIDQERSAPSDGASERRRTERFLTCFPATLRSLLDERQLCVCHDMSSFGGMFWTATEHKPGDALALELYIDAPGGNPHRAMARVIRVQRHRTHETRWRYDTAVEFASPTRELTAAAKALSELQLGQGLFPPYE